MIDVSFYSRYIYYVIAARLETRLVGGPDDTEGRVEVKYQDQWGSVCGDGFDMAEANVVCKRLGYK